ncbi:hypothetical protein PF008_g18691 [Phytophthora fragariae]|uniref:Uncharacterized protein n=1 Tax=Phytophthora fragariae TaxID=53985 RepID=A0A6G0R4L0_9STRA|nr:hypothetical protein PF008_g18691 [Phytophthora fragariae]
MKCCKISLHCGHLVQVLAGQVHVAVSNGLQTAQEPSVDLGDLVHLLDGKEFLEEAVLPDRAYYFNI